MKIYKKNTLQKLTALLLALLMLLALPACNNAADAVTTPSITTQADPLPNPPQDDDPPVVEMLPAQEVKVLDQNVLNGNASAVAQRAPAMIEYFLSYDADSIGLQEAGSAWADALDEGLKDKYARVGVECGSGADKGSFATYVYYRKDKYRVIATDTFWMSTTPDVPSKYSSTVDMNRTCTWVILEDIETGFRYVHMNCHLDWMDASVNVVQTTMIRNMIIRFAEMGYPVFATGDYNTAEGLVSYGQMLASDLVHDSRYLAEKSDITVSHFGNGATIDYCFVTGAYMTVKEFDVVDHVHGDVEVSDHNGIFVHAEVRSLPKQTHPVPQFADDAEITLTPGKGHMARSAKITLSQARDAYGSVAKAYEVVLKDESGNEVSKITVFANSYRPLAPLSVTASLSGGISGKTYQLEVTPISIFGDRGTTVTSRFVWDSGEEIVVKAPNDPDIVDIFVSNGVAVDVSPNMYQLTQIGTVNITNNAMVFNKGGNIRTPNISSQYAKMTDGFTMEAVITTGTDITTSQNYISNQHAGGYAFFCEKGKLRFSVHNGASYVYASAEIEANTTYHVIGIYDGTDLYFYLNGDLVAVAYVGNTMGLPTADGACYLCIGADSDKSGNGEYPAELTVHKVALYSEVLTLGEVIYLSQNQS